MFTRRFAGNTLPPGARLRKTSFPEAISAALIGSSFKVPEVDCFLL
jgi:hypothetical protein